MSRGGGGRGRGGGGKGGGGGGGVIGVVWHPMVSLPVFLSVHNCTDLQTHHYLSLQGWSQSAQSVHWQFYQQWWHSSQDSDPAGMHTYQ